MSPQYFPDEEPTLRMKVVILPNQQVMMFPAEKKYPRLGFILCLATGLIFWGVVLHWLAAC